MSNKKNKSTNYLDYIPQRIESYKWDQDKEGNVTIFVENKGIFNRIAQKTLKKPEVSQIHLQGIGNFVWSLIDGETSIYDLGIKVKEHYGDEAEPLYERLSEYMRMLEQYGFISIKKEINE